MRPSLVRALTITLVTVLFTACSDGTGPDSDVLTGTYALVAVDGHAPPVLMAEGAGQSYTLLADTLRFEEGGDVRRTTVVRHTSVTTVPATDTTYTQDWSLPYERDGHRVTIGYTDPCPPNALCIGYETGTLIGPDLRVDSRIQWSGERVLIFRRLPRP